MKKLTVGILAHVDAGKTTLTESLLFVSGMIRKQGTVDEGSAFLDTETLEKKRGVTIHSKQAIIDLAAASLLNKCSEDVRLTLIDTPGHSDFSGEAERSLAVLDLAILLISAKDAGSDESERFIHMLKSRNIPYIIFVNKMDQEAPEKDVIIRSLRKLSGEGVFEYKPGEGGDLEDIAALSEETIESFLESGILTDKEIASLIYSGAYHPVVFGAAARNEGTEELLNVITGYMPDPSFHKSLSMRIFRITHEDGHRLAFAKITGGAVSVREVIPDDRLEDGKITQIRLYSGAGYESVPRAEEGDVVALSGLDRAFSGMGIGEEQDDGGSMSCPVLRYTLILPEDVPLATFMPHLNELALEDPLLDPVLSGEGDTVSIAVMGEFQLEILSLTIKERFGVDVSFDKGRIIYKETIADTVTGYGHFEPLRHYAEIHILMEPLPAGSGIKVESRLSTDVLDINWQKTVMHVLKTDLPDGVLTGSYLTDIRFTLINGRSHTKHTEGGDFQEAARRAVRQGLMKADCRLLEPWYDFRITLPTESIGRVISDVNLMKGNVSVTLQDEKYSTLDGSAPAKGIAGYQSELTRFTSGKGRILLSFSGYRECDPADALEVIKDSGYDPDKDPINVSGSVFTRQGAGRYIPWNECESCMHV